jgi:hypothetical protein
MDQINDFSGFSSGPSTSSEQKFVIMLNGNSSNINTTPKNNVKNNVQSK